MEIKTVAIQLPNGFKHANPDDASVMAQLVNIAGEGFPLYLWTSLADEGQSPWELGRERAKRESGGFSYVNTILREQDGEVVASLISYPLDDDPVPTDYTDMPAMFVPLQQLEDLVPGTWYVNVLATFPKHRGRGIGTELLSIAESLAIEAGMRGMSIIVSDANHGARKLYERNGYIEVAQRPLIKENWVNAGENWVLLAKYFQ